MIENQLRTTQIVAAYVRKNLIRTDQIAGLINSVHSTLSGLGNDVVEEPPRVAAVSIRRSVHTDYLICIECGFKGKMLKGHLQSRHGLSVAEYRSRWKLSSGYPVTAANYSERRSQLAKSIGLGRGSSQSTVTPEAPAPEATPEKPVRRHAASKAAKTRTSSKKFRAKTTTKMASSKTSAKKTNLQKAGSRISAKRASSKASAKTASNRSRKPAARATSKAASVREVATA